MKTCRWYSSASTVPTSAPATERQAAEDKATAEIRAIHAEHHGAPGVHARTPLAEEQPQAGCSAAARQPHCRPPPAT